MPTRGRDLAVRGRGLRRWYWRIQPFLRSSYSARCTPIRAALRPLALSSRGVSPGDSRIFTHSTLIGITGEDGILFAAALRLK
jgi:hypothetical protein